MPMRSMLVSCCLLAVSSSVPAQTPTLSIREDLRIGTVDGPEHYQFDQIAGVLSRPSGEIVVLDNGSAEVRVYSPSGQFMHKFGGRGDGPGEIHPPAWMRGSPDHIVVMDQNARATFFEQDGTVVYTIPLYGPGQPSVLPIAKSPNGWLAIVTQPGRRRPPVAPGETYQDSVTIHVIDLQSGRIGRPSFRYPGARVVGMPSSPDHGGVANRPLFSSDPVLGVDGEGRMYVTDGNAYRIAVHDPTGRLERVIAPDHTPRTVERDHIDRYAEQVRAMFAVGGFWNPELQMKNTIDDRIASPYPEYLPATGAMLVAPSGTVWVERIDLMEDPGSWEFRETFGSNAEWAGSRPPAATWDRFDTSGVFTGSVSLPASFKPFDATDDAILGVIRDELDVEYVVRFRLSRAETS